MKSVNVELRRLKWELRVARMRWDKRPFGRRSHLPVVFGNAMAKSGSHVLSQLLEGLSEFTPLVYVDMHPIRTRLPGTGARPKADVLRDLRRLKRGDMGWGYLPADPAYLEAFRADRSLVFFLYRDPRDKILSEIHYATEIHTGHGLRGDFQAMANMEERISASIRGIPGRLKSIREIYESYDGWRRHPGAHALRFEDLIHRREAALDGVLQVLEAAGVAIALPWDEAKVRLGVSLSPARSPTFRSGSAGGWRREFTERNVSEFKEVTGDLLQAWGYEQDDRWTLTS